MQSNFLTIGNCTDRDVLKDIGVSSFEICFVCISNDLESPMVITTLLKDLGAKKVVTKLNQDLHAKFLITNGADEVIYPERDMARRTAMKYSTLNAFDYLELNSNYGIFEISPPTSWIGRTSAEINILKRYHVNVIAYKDENQINPLDREVYTFKPEQHLIVAGDMKSFNSLISKKLQK
ncbi:MAG: TrkA family potassium uptake protein [Peptostreptococcaceae bacterium]|nr:TrkA family potassium uptake protein [Peptostreptococcaceae bacterium]